MNERPILFNAEMVNGVLSGRKTQTRRPVKFPFLDKNFGCELSGNELAGEVSAGNYRNCPFGAIGDRLWVRETWSDVNLEGSPAVAYRADDEVRCLNEDDGDESDPNCEKYKFASWCPDLISGKEGRWRPSIHMPRWASRITLEITGVRVERLQDISQADAQKEGCELTGWVPTYADPDNSGGHETMTPCDNFATLWQSICGEESWQSNPWVWVIEFKRVEQES